MPAIATLGQHPPASKYRRSVSFGLAGYCSPVPSHNKSLNTTAGGGLSKYGPAGWTAQGGVTAAMLASICLSWPQLGRGLVLTTKIVVCYCLSPR